MMDRKKASFLLLWGYLWVLFIFQAIDVRVHMTVIFGLLLGGLSCFLTYLTLKVFTDKVTSFRMEGGNSRSVRYGILIAGVTVFLFGIYLAGQYPGGMSGDTVQQYGQALGEVPYNDWHPVLHTFLFFTIPLKTGHQLGFLVFLQLLYFGLAFGYLGYVLHRNRCPVLFLSVICLYVWFNPFLATYMMYPWKDIGMTIFAVLLMACDIQIICSGGEWLRSRRNLVLFAVSSVACCFMRHNAVLFVAPLVLIVLFYAARDRRLRMEIVLSIAVCFLAVKVLYAFLDVGQPGKRTVEVAGLPATIWCNVMQKNEEALPEATREVMYRLASRESYEEFYETGDFNSIKWSGTYDTDGINRMSCGEILKYTWQCFRCAPQESMEALAELTDLVWAVDGQATPESVVVVENSWGIFEQHKPAARVFLKQIRDLFSAGMGQTLFGSIGFGLLAMFIPAVMMLLRGRSSFLHILPLFCYDFGTMLLLSGEDYRFFLPGIPLWLPVIFLMLKDQKTFYSCPFQQ